VAEPESDTLSLSDIAEEENASDDGDQDHD
jgi:hypothetical protein